MLEYLIRPRDHDTWLSIHADDMARVLAPRGWTCEVVAGWGDHRIRIQGTELAFRSRTSAGR